jgi:hypothetical protein
MKTSNPDQKRVGSFEPESAFRKMSELLTQLQDLAVLNKKEADIQKLELSKEILRLSRSIKEFYKDKAAKHKKKKKDSK